MKKINREKLYDLYMNKVYDISDKCDWKTTFGPKEIVEMICDIIEKNPEIYEEK